LTTKRLKINSLKEKLNEEEQDWLELYCEAHQEDQSNSFIRKQIERARNKLIKKFSEKELSKIVKNSQEIKDLESQLNNLQVQEQSQTHIQILPK
jgi:hypothetical protein